MESPCKCSKICAFNTLTGRIIGNRSLGRPRCRWEDNIRMDPKEIGIYPVGLSVKILKALLPPSILATSPTHLNFLDLITLTIVGER